MTRSGQQLVNLDLDDVTIEIPSSRQALLDLQALHRGTGWQEVRPCLLPSLSFSLVLASVVMQRFTPFQGYAAYAGFVVVATIVTIFTSIGLSRRSRRIQLTEKLLEQLLAEQNEQRRQLEHLITTKS
jgi:hypothetical protein